MPSVRPLPLLWTDLQVALYARISQDRQGKGLGVRRQDEDCTELCAGRGLVSDQIQRFTADNDKSATKDQRADFQRLMDEVRANRVQIIVAYRVDRLTRKPDEASEMIRLANPNGLRLVVTVAEGEFNLLTPDGIKRFRDAVADAEHETGVKSERQDRQRRQAAEHGRWNGGGVRPFGYRRVYVGKPPYQRLLREEIDETEAAIIREAAKRLLAGEGYRSIVRDFADRGITGTGGRPIGTEGLKKILRSARISGRREHHGKIVSDTATWPAIVDAETSDRLRTIIDRTAAPTRAIGRKYLLSGILRCPHCGWQLTGRSVEKTKRYIYLCMKKAQGTGGCMKTSISMPKADAVVRDMALEAFDSPEFWKRLTRTDEDAADVYTELRDVEDDLAALATDFGRRRITREEWHAARAGLVETQERLRRKLEASERLSVLSDLAALPGSMLDRWKALTDGQHRALVEAAIIKITVTPGWVDGRYMSVVERLTRDVEWRV